jgi:predicted ATPase/DNA-binding NarL/FixJ family response regulator/transcriptional regulator with XRE-family HTH domain
MDYEERVPNEKLIRARLEKGWTQARLAEEVGTTFETVSRWERGVVIPGLFYREKLYSIFGKTATELGLDQADTASLSSAGSTRIVFIASAYADAERKFVVSLKKELAARDITLWSSGLVKRQAAHHKSAILEEVIRAVQLVLVILSPHSKGSTHVRHSRDLARHFKQPVCEIWIEGESLQDCLPDSYGEPGVVIDARQGEDVALRKQIIATIERLAPGDPGTIELSEPMWNVPEPTKSLIGREEPLAKVCKLLRGPHARLITLTGPGGIGKTRLALQVAREVRERFVDGTCFVSLTNLHDHTFVVPTIAKELGIREGGDSPLIESVKVALKQKHFLLLLDNFEHMLEASTQLLELLAACPHLKMVVTSRARLRGLAERGDEARFVLHELDALSQDGAIALFEQRARVARGTFEITSATLPLVTEICERLDKLPLAIELAAARLGPLSAQDLLARLKHHPQDAMENIFIDLDRTVSDRQRSLYNTIGWSYHFLHPGEQRLFRRLAVFAGGCSLDALEAMSDALDQDSSHVWQDVESLLDKNLLRSRERKGEVRLYLFETIREYGLGLLKANGEEEITRRTHAHCYVRLAEEAAAHLKGEQQTGWLEKLEREVKNLRAALNWLIVHNEAEQALLLCSALWCFWQLYGYWSEGRRWLETALALPTTAFPTAARARALYTAGDLAYYQDDTGVARALLEESAQLCRTLGDNRTLGLALGTLGVLMHEPGTHATAHAMLDESEKLCRTLDNPWELAYVLRRKAQHYMQDGYLRQAIDYLREGLVLAKKLGDRSLAANTLGTLGETAARQGDILQASAYNRESLSFAREINNKHLLANALNNLDYFSALQGEPTLASNALDALKLSRELGDQLLINRSLNTLGYAALHQRNLPQAMVWYREGLSHAIEWDNKAAIGWNLYGLALVAEAEEQHAQAARLFGAVEACLDINADMTPAERAEYTRVFERVRAHLGTKSFAAIRREGQALTPAQILVAPRPAPVMGTPPSPRYPNGLTKRDVQILCLLTRGLTYHEIAAKLNISPRTVNTALTRAYDKISVSKSATSSDGKDASRVAPRIAAARFMEEHDLC